MALEGKGRFFKSGKANTLYLSIPSEVAIDSAFPFGEDVTVTVRVEADELRVIPTEQEE